MRDFEELRYLRPRDKKGAIGDRGRLMDAGMVARNFFCARAVEPFENAQNGKGQLL
jgi:hypothetical protein